MIQTFRTGYNPIYQSGWDANFRQQTYKPAAIRCLASLPVFYHLYRAGIELGGRSSDEQDSYSGLYWGIRILGEHIPVAVKSTSLVTCRSRAH